jgi:hypothetical protein
MKVTRPLFIQNLVKQICPHTWGKTQIKEADLLDLPLYKLEFKFTKEENPKR